MLSGDVIVSPVVVAGYTAVLSSLAILVAYFSKRIVDKIDAIDVRVSDIEKKCPAKEQSLKSLWNEFNRLRDGEKK